MEPRPVISPGRLASSSTVIAGMVRLTRAANPGGITPASGPAGAGVREVGRAGAPGAARA
jgi:hypothetical protein